MTSSPVLLSIVIPCYNEEEALDLCAEAMRSCLRALIANGKISSQSKVVFVNDGSRDRTWQLIEKWCQADPMFGGLCLSRNFGHQYALLAGLHHSPGEALISIDADLQDDLGVIEKMVDHYASGFDIVYGVRDDRSSDTPFKRWSAQLFYRLMSIMGTKSIYNHADYRLMSRRAVEGLREFQESSLFLRGMVPLIGFPQTTVTYARGLRVAGETKYPLSKMLKLSLNAITSFSSVPLRLITYTAVFGILFSFALSIYALAIRVFTNDAAPGWTSILLPVLFIGSLNLLATGVMGEYVARIFDEVKARPRYFVSAFRNLPQA